MDIANRRRAGFCPTLSVGFPSRCKGKSKQVNVSRPEPSKDGPFRLETGLVKTPSKLPLRYGLRSTTSQQKRLDVAFKGDSSSLYQTRANNYIEDRIDPSAGRPTYPQGIDLTTNKPSGLPQVG